MTVDYQDVLAELGAGSAHPGGHDSTVQWLEKIPWHKSMRVLDVGCGTGRTLLYVNQLYGCEIFGIDVRKKMVQKAKTRAARAGQSGVWNIASAEKIPFQAETFDVVFTESVNVFVDHAVALKEYYRVLKPDGWYVDVEMLVLGPTDQRWRDSVARVYGARSVPDQRGWKQRYLQAGFHDVHVVFTKPVRPMDMASADQEHPDDVDLATPGAYQNPGVIDILRQNSEWLETHHLSLGYAVFVVRKSAPKG